MGAKLGTFLIANLKKQFLMKKMIQKKLTLDEDGNPVHMVLQCFA